jgi:hypothetical protein
MAGQSESDNCQLKNPLLFCSQCALISKLTLQFLCVCWEPVISKMSWFWICWQSIGRTLDSRCPILIIQFVLLYKLTFHNFLCASLNPSLRNCVLTLPKFIVSFSKFLRYSFVEKLSRLNVCEFFVNSLWILPSAPDHLVLLLGAAEATA